MGFLIITFFYLHNSIKIETRKSQETARRIKIERKGYLKKNGEWGENENREKAWIRTREFLYNQVNSFIKTSRGHVGSGEWRKYLLSHTFTALLFWTVFTFQSLNLSLSVHHPFLCRSSELEWVHPRVLWKLTVHFWSTIITSLPYLPELWLTLESYNFFFK